MFCAARLCASAQSFFTLPIKAASARLHDFSLNNLIGNFYEQDMDRALRPERLETDPNQSEASKDWQHWRRTFENFVDVVTRDNNDEDEDMEATKFKILPNFLSPKIYQYIEECTSYQESLMTLEAIYVKPANEMYARHTLATRRQQTSETLTEYLQALRVLSKDCNFEAVSAVRHRDEFIRDAFIAGLQSPAIRQRLLEHRSLDLESMFYQAQALESAASSSEGFSAQPSFNAAVPDCRRAESTTSTDLQDAGAAAAAIPSSKTSKCFFCGNTRHLRFKCPAREATCLKDRKSVV